LQLFDVRALGFGAAAPTETLSLKNEQTRLRKELQANIRRWIGTLDSPWIAHVMGFHRDNGRNFFAPKLSKTEVDLMKKTFFEAAKRSPSISAIKKHGTSR
jgi:hypothetical protein